VTLAATRPAGARSFIAPARPYVGQAVCRHAQLHGSHGTAGGQPGARRCGGTLRWVDVEGPIPLAGCDTCSYEAGMLR
jgi:hypothetical protein